MKLAKLDAYNYSLLTGFIRIHVDGPTDPDLVDIMSEIELAKGRIYVEGRRYRYLDDYMLSSEGGKFYMDLRVEEPSSKVRVPLHR